MIHLDRNHHPSPLDTHEKQLDSHPILSWEDHLSHDDQPFQQDFIPDATTTTTASERVTSDNDAVPPKPGPVTPIDANDPAHTHSSSPASPADGNSTSPTRDRSSSLSPVPETGSPHTQTDTRSSPPAPPAAEEKEAPEEVPTREEEEEPEEVRVADKASRVSTPLSELSPPPPDQEDEPEPPKPEEQQKENPPEAPKEAEAETASVQQEQPLLSIRQSPPNNLPSPSTPLTPIAPNTSSGNDPKVVSILELNVELLKICLAFQTRGIGGGDARFQQYSTRLQSNLTWLAAAADHSRVGNHSNMQLPIMDAPQPVDFAPMDRIRQIYVELPSIFAKEIARRHTMGIGATQTLPPSLSGSGTPGIPVNTNLKRDREDSPADSMSKRRDTGEGKGMSMGIGIGMGNPGAMLPPPTALPMASPAASQFLLPMTNGSSGPVLGGGPQQGAQSHGIDAGVMPGGAPGLGNPSEAQLAASQRERVRQEQIRAAQQQQQNAARQISPTSSSSGGPGGVGAGMPRGQPPMQGNAAAGPSNLGGGGGGGGGPGGGMGVQMNRANMQQAYQVLQQPNHPFVQYMQSQVPGFQQMTVQMQVQKMVMAQAAIQASKQDGHGPPNLAGQQPRPGSTMSNPQQQMGGMPMQGTGGMPGSQFNSPTGIVSPVQHQQHAQNSMFPMGNSGPGSGGMDPRAMAGNPPGGLPPGMNLNNTSGHQRQLMMLQQQQRASGSGGGGGGPGGSGGIGGMNPMMMSQVSPQQQQMFAQQQQQQERMRQAAQEHQRLQAAQAGSPTHPSSPMPNDTFPALRSNSTIPGIARSARSPSDSAPSPMTPRAPTRGPSIGQEDYQRMLMQQQQNQAARAMVQNQGPSQGLGFPQQMGGSGPGWPNSQQQQGMSMGGGGPGGSGYGMSPPGSSGGNAYGSAPSPSNSTSQNSWGTQGGYPFVPSPVADQLRHMSGTPVSQQSMGGPQNTSPPADPSMSTDYDLFNWAA